MKNFYTLKGRAHKLYHLFINNDKYFEIIKIQCIFRYVFIL